MNDDVYRACDWIIPYIDFGEAQLWLVDQAATAGCELTESRLNGLNDDELYFRQVMIRAPSEQAFQQFITAAAGRFELKVWYAISSELFDAGLSLDPRVLFKSETYLIGTAPQYWERLGGEALHNASRVDFLKYAGKGHSYYGFNWIIDSPDISEFKNLTAIAAELESSVYLIRPFPWRWNEYEVLMFSVRSPSEEIGIQLLDKIAQIVKVAVWYAVSENFHYKSGLNLHVLSENWTDMIDSVNLAVSAIRNSKLRLKQP